MDHLLLKQSNTAVFDYQMSAHIARAGWTEHRDVQHDNSHCSCWGSFYLPQPMPPILDKSTLEPEAGAGKKTG
ncbi:MAG: hypothetical protein BMS9Abin33_0023 [Gammaproteobacteria bacterium]|nr:MAG: hypothetical protein BMS9Abin33_0023 [Gammaproteobacteria bacterium]